MPHRNVPKKVAKKQKNRTWDKKLKTLRKQYQAKPTEDTIHRGANTRPSFHLRTAVVGGRQKAHPVPQAHPMKP